jgi:hypothetical protein
MSDQNKEAYIRWLEDPKTKLSEGEGRHPALVILVCSYFNRRKGEWRNFTDDQRRAKLWEWNQRQKVPKPEKEFNQIWKWIVDKFRRERDARWEAEDEATRKTAEESKKDSVDFGPYVNAELEGSVFYKINEKPGFVQNIEQEQEQVVRGFRTKLVNDIYSRNFRTMSRASGARNREYQFQE